MTQILKLLKDSEILKFLTSAKFFISVVIAVTAVSLVILLKNLQGTGLYAKKAGRRGTVFMNGINRAVRYLLLVLAVLVILQINGVNISGLFAGLGLAGVIVGFAMQSLLEDMLMGINLVTEGFMKVGDVIEYEGAYWQVTDIGLRAVKLKRLGTGDLYTVSARLLTQVHVMTDRMELIVPGDYHVPAEEMRQVCREICAEAARHDEIREAELLGTDAFRESQIDYRIRVVCDPMLRDRARRLTLAAMQDVMAAHGIAVPFNQLDVHLDESKGN